MMLTLLLKAFPKRFQEDLGKEWLLDTRRELGEARQAGLLPYARTLARTLTSAAIGASSAHVHEVRWQFSQARQQWVSAGGALIASGDLPRSWPVDALLIQAGAALCGHQIADIFLRFWVEDGARRVSELGPMDLKFSILGFMLASSPFWLLGVGAYLVCNERARKFMAVNKYLGAVQRFLVCALFAMAFAASFLMWTIRDLSNSSAQLVAVLQEYPLLGKSMGLAPSDEEPGSEKLFSPTGALLPEVREERCARAEAAFESASVRWQQLTRQSGEMMPLLLLSGRSRELWASGCWSEEEAMAYNKGLVTVAQEVSMQNARRVHFQGLGQAKVSRDFMLKRIPYLRREVCQVKMQASALLSLQDAAYYCAQIPYAKSSVHEKGSFILDPKDVAKWSARRSGVQ